MTEKRKIQVLFGLILVLAITWIAGILTSPRVNRSGDEPLLSFPWDSVKSIELNELKLDGSNAEQWIVEGEAVPARNDRIDQLLTAFTEASRIRTVASQQESLESFGLDDPGILVVSGGEEAKFYFGDSASGAKEVFVTIEGETPIFTTSDELSFYFRQTPVYWKDIRLFPQKPELESIELITITISGDSFSLTKSFDEETQSTSWLFTEAEDVIDVEKADGFVRTFFRFEARDIVRDVSIADELGKITLTDNDGKKSFFITVHEAPPSEENETQFYLIPSGLRNEYVFLVTESVKDRILRNRDHFIVDADGS